MRKLSYSALAVILGLTFAAGARAEVPFLMPVVGVITTTDDTPIEGSHEVTFNLYSAPTGGVTLGGETQTVQFDDGLFRAYLGSTTASGLSITPFIDYEEIWLGMRIGADSEMSRVRLASVPWAFEAETCREVTNLTEAGIQPAIPAAACEANQAMRGWSGGAAQCVNLPSIAGLVANSDIGTTVQAPISQASFPCNYGIRQIAADGTVVCANQNVVTHCGVDAGGNENNYLGSDGNCHPAPHSCAANQYLDGGGNCREAPHKCAAGQVLDGDGVCQTVVPVGGIIMWSGTDIPTGWSLCDGTNGTPNLVDRFIVGAGDSYSIGNTGGDDSVALTTAQLPSHTHTMSAGGTHRHQIRGRSATGINSSDCTTGCGDVVLWNDDGQWATPGTAGNQHRWTISSTDASSDAAVGQHSHTINSTGGGQPHENRPPYFALAYIMRVD